MVHDLVSITKSYKGELHEFFLDMRSWGRFKTRAKLVWDRVDFSAANHPVIPKVRGVYVFTLEHREKKLPPHGYILYVGITGDGESEATLHSRYAQYIRHQKTRVGRPAVTYMLENWADYLSFYYSPVANPKVSLASIESKFINACIPPINKRDMSAEITAIKAAAF